MDDHFQDQLRERLGNFLPNDQASITDFQQWFTTAWWAAEEGASEELYALGSRIEHLLYIWSSGEWSDKTFRADLDRATHAYLTRLP